MVIHENSKQSMFEKLLKITIVYEELVTNKQGMQYGIVPVFRDWLGTVSVYRVVH